MKFIELEIEIDFLSRNKNWKEKKSHEIRSEKIAERRKGSKETDIKLTLNASVVTINVNKTRIRNNFLL